jgi:hypothetical protein
MNHPNRVPTATQADALEGTVKQIRGTTDPSALQALAKVLKEQSDEFLASVAEKPADGVPVDPMAGARAPGVGGNPTQPTLRR